MPKQKIILIVGIVLALISVFMVISYLDQQRQIIMKQAKKALADAQANQIAVLVAKKDIAKGTIIEPDLLETEIVPKPYVQPQAVTSLDRVSGMIAITSISKDEQITLSKLSRKQQAEGGSLAMTTPIGKRAITISVDNISSLAGMIRPGDYVDIIALLPVPIQTPEGKQTSQVAVIPLFQNIQVLAVGQETGTLVPPAGRPKKEEKVEASPLITLALNPQEINLIAFVQEQGKLRLVGRSTADSQIQPIQPATWDTLFQYMMPQVRQGPEIEQKQEPKPTAQPTNYVEIYRGLNKEKIPLSP